MIRNFSKFVFFVLADKELQVKAIFTFYKQPENADKLYISIL
jgi:hypothetical protein